MDPNTLYGSPYGGFSRAVQSRLASRPLRLPDVTVDSDSKNEGVSFHKGKKESFWEISDKFGRKYACGLFHEDDVGSLSLYDSMFEPPKLYNKFESDDNNNMEGGGDDAHVLGELEGEEVRVTDVERRLDLMKGVCVLRRGKYFTYEWCWERRIQQFHLEYKGTRSKEPSGKATPLSRFGHFHSREVSVQHYSLPVTQFLIETTATDQVARVKEIYTDGDECSGPEGHKRTVVNFHCCPPKSAVHSSDLFGSVWFSEKFPILGLPRLSISGKTRTMTVIVFLIYVHPCYVRTSTLKFT